MRPLLDPFPSLPPSPSQDEKLAKFRIVLMVLEAGGSFSGVNRKVGSQ